MENAQPSGELNNCPECLEDMERAWVEKKAQCELFGISLYGVCLASGDWPDKICPHGRRVRKFELVVPGSDAGPIDADTREILENRFQLLETHGGGGVRVGPRYPGMDATKDIGYPVREHGPYGSHPACDDFDDESGPDGSGFY